MTEQKIKIFDLVIIGGGSAGLSVASAAAQLGLHVALLERDKMGGDCLNTGCVPSKSLLAASKYAHMMRSSDAYGIESVDPVVNFSAVKDYVFKVISRIEPHDSVERFEGLGVTVIKDAGKFVGRDVIELSDGSKIKAKNFVIATGSRARVPDIPGLEKDKVLTNENIFELRQKPDRLIIIGGGPIGIEMAQAHKRLGSKVTIIDSGEILSKDDAAHVEVVRTVLSDEGVKIIERAAVKELRHTGPDSVELVYTKGGEDLTVRGSHVLVATGRLPNVETLGLEEAGVTYSDRGIETDKRLRTSNKKIYAAGDVIGGPQFTHVAGYHAGIIVKNLIFKIPAKVDYTALPWVTYTDPELAQVGVTEDVAKEKYGESIRVVTWSFKDNDRALAEGKTQGRAKVITLKNGRVIGASIVGPSAGDLLGVWSVIISSKMKIGAVADIIAPYPTLGEINKRLAGAYYTPSLFSDKTRFFVSLLQRLPF
jgi:pyruvate/2-oxoglutarate dehydrogenase complex dihydrolipoamide dehydrogenase (E3) component